MDITGLDGVIRLFEAASAVTSANTNGSPPAARATLMAIGTITMVAPTWLITSAKQVVSKPTMSWITHIGMTSGSRSSVCPATQAAAPLESIAQPSGIGEAIRNTDVQLIAE